MTETTDVFDQAAEPFKRDPVRELRAIDDADVRVTYQEPTPDPGAPVVHLSTELAAAIDILSKDLDAFFVHIDPLLTPAQETPIAPAEPTPPRSKMATQLAGWARQITDLSTKVRETDGRLEL